MAGVANGIMASLIRFSFKNTRLLGVSDRPRLPETLEYASHPVWQNVWHPGCCTTVDLLLQIGDWLWL